MNWGTVVAAGVVSMLLVGGLGIGFISWFNGAPWAIAITAFLSGGLGAMLYGEMDRKDRSN